MSRKDKADDALLAAYVDGVAELSTDERHRVESLLERDAGARAEADATRTMIDRLRGLPAEGQEPDWSELERQIRSAVGPVAPRPWWKRWFWLAPVGALVAAAAGILLWISAGRTPVETVTPPPVTAHEISHDVAQVARDQPVAQASDDASSLMWLDGDFVDLDDVDPSKLPDEIATEDTSSGPLLSAPDFGWIDDLDDSALDQAESWLSKRKG
jgi:anti-sigma factor RsiW